MDFPKHPELFRVGRDEALARQKGLTVNAVERDGADANLLMHAMAAMAEEVVGQLVGVAEGQYLDSARRDKLLRTGFDRYGILPSSGSPATGQVSFSTTAPNPTAFPLPVNTVLATSDGRQFLTSQQTTFPVATTGPVTVEIRSSLAGAVQQAAAGTIRNIVSRIPGAPSDLAVTNTLATAGAADAESDTEYAARCRRIFRSLRRGTRFAIETAALAVPGVKTAQTVRIIDALGRPTMMVQLYVTDQFTSALIVQGANPPAYQAQSQAFARQVYSQIQDWVCDGVYLQVLVASVKLQPVLLQLHFVAGVDTATTATIARATIVQYVNTQIVSGQTLTRLGMIAALRTVPGLAIQGDEISSPAGDVVPAGPLEVIRTDMSLVQTSVQDLDAATLNVPAVIS